MHRVAAQPLQEIMQLITQDIAFLWFTQLQCLPVLGALLGHTGMKRLPFL